MRSLRLASLVPIVAFASACAGGSMLPGAMRAGPTGAAAYGSRGRVPVAIHVVIGRAHHHRRHAHFVSPGTNGLAIAFYPHGAPQTQANVVASAVVDVSPGSKACGGQTGYPRTCGAQFALAP